MPGRRTRPAPASSPSPSSVRHGGGGSGRIGQNLRRRICTEAKAKVVAAVWGAEFIKFLAELVV